MVAKTDSAPVIFVDIKRHSRRFHVYINEQGSKLTF